jgi:hypothetical protein
MMILAVGPTRWDPTCVHLKDSVPHVSAGATSQNSERLFAAGNERSIVDITQYTGADTMTGYQLNKDDSFRLIVDLMNMNMEDKIVYLTMTYEYLSGPLRAGWMDTKPVWLDIDQCGMSEVHPPEQNGKFTLTSAPWSPTFEGIIGGVGGHVHDGGVNVQIYATNTTEVCNSVAKYGESAEYYFKEPTGGMMGDMHIAQKHISSMTTCWFGEMKVQELKKEQQWVLKGNYDYEKFEGNTEGGKQADVMVLAIMFIAVPPGGVPRPSI